MNTKYGIKTTKQNLKRLAAQRNPNVINTIINEIARWSVSMSRQIERNNNEISRLQNFQMAVIEGEDLRKEFESLDNQPKATGE